ncbi:MAG: hypothetical protein HY753_07955, partial [Nitrospirae bacterium]|nr:hypothetical protein [Nitrospirota bacterium]
KVEIQNAITATNKLFAIKTEGWGDRVEKLMPQSRKDELISAAQKEITHLELKRWTTD